MRLIDADAFIARLDHVPMVQEAIKKAMDHMPTVDAVEVVRCKDCVHYMPYDWMFSEIWKAKILRIIRRTKLDASGLTIMLSPMDIAVLENGKMDEYIRKQAAIEIADAVWTVTGDKNVAKVWDQLKDLPSADVVEVVRCKDCKYWRRQTNYAGAQLSFGFCESDDMWRSLYGETYEVAHIDTDDDFYCGYAERREDG